MFLFALLKRPVSQPRTVFSSRYQWWPGSWHCSPGRGGSAEQVGPSIPSESHKTRHQKRGSKGHIGSHAWECIDDFSYECNHSKKMGHLTGGCICLSLPEQRVQIVCLAVSRGYVLGYQSTALDSASKCVPGPSLKWCHLD